MSKAYLALDLGAESGRAIVGILDSGKIELHELHRFANTMQQLPDGYHWNTVGLFGELIEGLRRAGRFCADRGVELVSLGVDTWGVDFGLIGDSGGLVGMPFAYRDARNEPAMGRVLAQLGEERLYAATGIQFMPFNTIFQLAAWREHEPKLLDASERLLFMPDLLHYFFTGEMVNEASIASTSGAIDPRTGTWAGDLLDELNIPRKVLGDPVKPGTVVGTLRPEIADIAGLTSSQASDLRVITPAGHDTASAIAAVPADAETNWAYLSSGTWSLMGVELTEPCLTEAARAAQFTNEGGVDGTIRFLKNISGLWLVQETRRDFEKRGESYDYVQLTQMASEAEPFRTLIDPGYAPFASPGGMIDKLVEFADKTGQPKPQTPGQCVRCCLESLALTYRHTMMGLRDVLDRQVDVLHIVGGGGKNELLDQMTADATGCTVIAGPDEATAAGNLLVQAMGAGDVADLAELRSTIMASFEPKTFTPADIVAWDAQYERYAGLLGS